MPRRARELLFAPTVALAFFASGAASLIAEVTWNRMLIVVVGNSLSATAMIIVIFMGGLGLGSYLGGRWFAGRRVSLLPYAGLEFLVGLLVLLSPLGLGLLTRFFGALAAGTDARLALSLGRLLVTTLVLFVPAALMGATFPAVIAGAGGRASRGAYLYSANTVGAALGTFAAGYHLLLEFGVPLTLRVAAGLYLLAVLAALAAWRLGGDPAAEATPSPTAAAPATAPAPAPDRRRFLLWATFAIGFVALAYEVLLTRLSILYLGNSVSVFPLVLTAFLLGTGISAWLGTWLQGRLAGSARLFGITALAAGVALLLVPYLLLSDRLVSAGEFARFADAQRRNPLPILLAVVAPTLLLGGLLPVAIRLLAANAREGTRAAATLYAVNTLGGLLGAGAVNHLLVPWLGLQAVLLGLFLICVATGLAALLEARRARQRWAMAGLTALGLTVLLAVLLPSLMQRYAQKVARGTGAAQAEVRLVLEGRAATVTVIDQADARLGSYRDIYLNGVEEASTRYWHTQLFKLLGALPVLIHPGEGPKDVLVIAFGAGITAGSTLVSPTVGALDVVDLNPDVEGINDLFRAVNGDVFHAPRFHFHADDGRNYLVTSRKRYDLIIGDSTHPRAYDSWILYTEEFYRQVAAHLKPGGIFAQWVPVLGSMRGDLMRIHLNTFRRVFPQATLWYVYGSDQAFLMATPEPLALDLPQLQARLDALPAWFRAEEYQLDRAENLAGFFWLDPPAFARMIGDETRVNTDAVHTFDKQSAVWPSPPAQQLPRFQASVLPYLRGAGEAVPAAVQARQRLARHLANYAFYRSDADLHSAYCLDPEEGNARYWMEREFAGEPPPADRFCAEREVAQYRELVAQQPSNALALNALADLLGQRGELTEAQALAERAVALAPDNGMILDTLGWVLVQRGELARGLAQLEHADRRLPGHPIVLYHLGAAQLAAGQSAAGRRNLERALAADPDFAGAADARRLLER